MWRKFLFWLLVLAFGWVIISRLSEIEKLITTLTQGKWQWVLVAILLQFLYFVTSAWVYQASFAVVGVKSQLRGLLKLTLAAVFINSTAPSGGAGGITLFVDDAKRRGESTARAAAGVLLVNVANFGSFLIILTIGLIILIVQQDIQTYELVTGLVMFAYVGAMVGVLVLGLKRPHWLETILQKLQNGINHIGSWFRKPALLHSDWAASNAAEFESSAQMMSVRPRELLSSGAIAIGAHLINLATLFALFLAFNVQPAIGIVIAGYAMTILFTIISPTPSGIGVVEGLMPVVYSSLGLDIAAATVVTFAFRGFTYWLPFLIGFFLFRQLKMFKQPESTVVNNGQAWFISLFVGGMGILNILSLYSPLVVTNDSLVSEYVPLVISWDNKLSTLLAGLGLLLLGYSLKRHLRSAFFLTILILIITIISNIVSGPAYYEAALAALLISYLITQRGLFQNNAESPNKPNALTQPNNV